jgi:peptidoglycan/LPS O-acetylase OafA/YrhL
MSMAVAGQHGANWLGVTWSLAIEEQFYLILPLIIRFVPGAQLPKVLCAMILVAPVLRTAFYFVAEHRGFPGFVLLPARWDSLLIGVLGAYFQRSTVVTVWLSTHPANLLGSLFVILFGMAVLMVTGQGIGSLWMSVFGHTWLALLGLNIIYVALFVKLPLVQVIFKNRALVWLGAISYGVYLYHQIVSGICYHLLADHRPYIAGASDVLVTLLALVITLLLAVLSWRYFERPIIGYGRRITDRASAPV